MSARGAAAAAQERLQQEQDAQRRRERRLLGLVALALVVLVVGGGLGFQHWRTGRAPTAVPTVTSSLTPVTVAPGKPIVLGQAGAPVTLQLYEDFHCPHCVDLESELGSLIAERQQSGRLAVELFAMSFIDQGSTAAANAMACAAEAGFGQAYYQGLFANATLRWSDDQLLQLAGRVSTTVPSSFPGCVTGRAQQGWVDSINATARTNGVTGTPTAFLQGRPVDVGTLTRDSLTTLLDQAEQQ